MNPYQLSHSFKFQNNQFIEPVLNAKLLDMGHAKSISSKVNATIKDAKLFLTQAIKGGLVEKSEIAPFAKRKPVALMEQAVIWYEQRIVPPELNDYLCLSVPYSSKGMYKLVFKEDTGSILHHAKKSESDVLNDVINYVIWFASCHGMLVSCHWYYLHAYSNLNESLSYRKSFFKEKPDLSPKDRIAHSYWGFEEVIDDMEELLYLLKTGKIFRVSLNEEIEDLVNNKDPKFYDVLNRDLDAFFDELQNYQDDLEKQESMLESINPQEIARKAAEIDAGLGQAVKSILFEHKTLIEDCNSVEFDTDIGDNASLAYVVVVNDSDETEQFCDSEIDNAINQSWESGETAGFEASLNKKSVNFAQQFAKKYPVLIADLEKVLSFDKKTA